MELFGILFAVSSLVGAVAFLVKGKDEKEIDVYSDYQLIMEAAAVYRENHGDYAKDIKKLMPLIEHAEQMNFKRYSLSLDGKFLVVSQLGAEESQGLINEIGGNSYINGNYTYLTLLRLNDVSKIKPVAFFTMHPSSGFTTTTPISYDHKDCVVEDGEIAEVKWENRQVLFKEPGFYTIRLKVKDKNGNWSDFCEKEIRVVEEKGISSISAYDGSYFVVYNCGKVLCRGKNESGQLGIGSLNPYTEMRYNSLHDGVAEIACGEGFNIFLFHDGSVGASGNNRHGELGTGDKTSQKNIKLIWGLENIVQISAGKNFAAALDSEGYVFAWGDNSFNQLMRDDMADAMLPVKIQGLEGIKQIVCGANFGLALRHDGVVMGWGDNSYGQLGVGHKSPILYPIETLYENVKHVFAGDKFTEVITNEGYVLGAGSNSFGQLGFKGKTEVHTPTRVPIAEVVSLAVKESVTMATLNNGVIVVWGNFNGPGSRPIFDPTQLIGIENPIMVANNGKKCYVLTPQYDLFIITDLLGKYEKKKYFENIHDFREVEES